MCTSAARQPSAPGPGGRRGPIIAGRSAPRLQTPDPTLLPCFAHQIYPIVAVVGLRRALSLKLGWCFIYCEVMVSGGSWSVGRPTFGQRSGLSWAGASFIVRSWSVGRPTFGQRSGLSWAGASFIVRSWSVGRPTFGQRSRLRLAASLPVLVSSARSPLDLSRRVALRGRSCPSALLPPARGL